MVLSLEELIAMGGVAKAIRLCVKFGGARKYIPKEENAHKTEWLVSILGEAKAREFAKEVGYGEVDLPSVGRLLTYIGCIDALRKGIPVSKVSRAYCIDDSSVWRLKKVMKEGVYFRLDIPYGKKYESAIQLHHRLSQEVNDVTTFVIDCLVEALTSAKGHATGNLPDAPPAEPTGPKWCPDEEWEAAGADAGNKMSDASEGNDFRCMRDHD